MYGSLDRSNFQLCSNRSIQSCTRLWKEKVAGKFEKRILYFFLLIQMKFFTFQNLWNWNQFHGVVNNSLISKNISWVCSQSYAVLKKARGEKHILITVIHNWFPGKKRPSENTSVKACFVVQNSLRFYEWQLNLRCCSFIINNHLYSRPILFRVSRCFSFRFTAYYCHLYIFYCELISTRALERFAN